MKKSLLTIAIIFVLQASLRATEKDSIVLSYIANCGFLIEMGSSKVLIDALFTDGFNFYATPDSETIEKMVEGQEPFNGVGLILVTHLHADHFDAQTVSRYMLAQPDCRLLCPQQVIDELAKHKKSYEKYAGRVLECTPDAFSSMTLQVDDLQLTAFNLVHMNQQNIHVQNIAYLIEKDGMAIFHTGDADPKQAGRFAAKKPSEYHIDIALINGAFSNYKEFKTTSSFINADTYVGMHYPKNFFNMEHEMPEDVPEYFKEPIVFKELMETQTFYFQGE